jgi:hypothetical protein
MLRQHTLNVPAIESNIYKKALKHCKNCNEDFIAEFCSGCGSPLELKRIDRKYIVDEISILVNLNKGFLYTIKELFIRPGDAVREFIHEDRKRLIKPILFLIICSVFYSLAQRFLSFELGFIKLDIDDQGNDLIIEKMYAWFSKNYEYTNVLMAIPITL